MNNARGAIGGFRLRWETEGELNGRVFWMNGAVVGSNDQGRIGPDLRAYRGWKVVRFCHGEKPEQRRFSFAKNHGAHADDA